MSKWTRDEFILVMNLYTKLRYGQFNSRNIEVINLSKLIGKTPGAVAFKLVHLSRQDPNHKERVKGLSNSGKNALEIYKEFTENWDDMLYKSEILLASYQDKKLEDVIFDDDYSKEFHLEILKDKKGLDIERIVNTRLNQSLFRKVVVNNYSNSCTICSLNIKELLVASHILKWSESQSNRLNPENGLCLCNIHDKAFELGYIGINSNYKVIISKETKVVKNNETFNAIFGKFENETIVLPDKFYPNVNFLERHLLTTFKGY